MPSSIKILGTYQRNLIILFPSCGIALPQNAGLPSFPIELGIPREPLTRSQILITFTFLNPLSFSMSACSLLITPFLQ